MSLFVKRRSIFHSMITRNSRFESIVRSCTLTLFAARRSYTRSSSTSSNTTPRNTNELFLLLIIMNNHFLTGDVSALSKVFFASLFSTFKLIWAFWISATFIVIAYFEPVPTLCMSFISFSVCSFFRACSFAARVCFAFALSFCIYWSDFSRFYCSMNILSSSFLTCS